MKRKINQVGTGTLTVSLPIQWVEQQGLKKGDELEVSWNKSQLAFSSLPLKKKEKEITLNIDHLNRYLLARYLDVLYAANYNRIILTYSKAELADDKSGKSSSIKTLIKQLSDRFIGMEIISQTKNSTELRCFLMEGESEVSKVEKRICFLFKEFASELASGKMSVEEAYEHHDQIAKFIAYYLKILDLSDLAEEEKKYLYSLYLLVDKLVDKMRHFNEKMVQFGQSAALKKAAKEVFGLVEELFLSLHKREISAELVSRRYALVKRIEGGNFSLKEWKAVSEIKIFLDIINDFSRAIVAGKISG